MSFLLDLINGVNKFLGYLDISTKYLNRAYTILSVIPTLYILRIIYGLAINHNYLQLFLYGLIFLGLVYFIILNVCFYFFDRNLKIDVTQLFVKVLPDDAFNIQSGAAVNASSIDKINTEKVAVDYQSDYQLKLADNLQKLIEDKVIKTNDLTQNEGFYIAKNTLYPYYFIKQLDDDHYSLQIGTSYQDLNEIGRITRKRTEGPLEPVGLFIVGGDFVKNGVRYHEPYRLKLIAKKTLTPEKEAAAEAETGLSRGALRQQKKKRR